jgi:hypothetical protein
MILMTARNEDRIFSYESTRSHVERYLGPPVTEEVVTPAVQLRSFNFGGLRSSTDSQFRSFLGLYSPGNVKEAKDLREIAFHCRYTITGRIVPHGEVGDMNATALMTFGLTEIVAIPVAIKEITPDKAVKNVFDVWYSREGQVLAYYWVWSKAAVDGAAPPAP